MSADRVKFLIVDDIDENLVALEALLRFPDADCFLAKSAQEALDLLLEHDFAVALIDVHMPEMGGLELAELMRGAEKTRAIPIIFVTADTRNLEHRFAGYESGAVDFLYKPLDSHIVRSKVQVFLDLERQRKLLTSQLRVTQKTLAELRKTETELHRALDVRDEFMSIASHELRTPITFLKLQMQMLLRKFDEDRLQSLAPERLRKMLGHCDRQAELLADLVEKLLDVTRIENGRLSLEVCETDLAGMLRDVIEGFADHARAQGVTIRLKAPETLIGHWDSQRIRQVVINLISNAVKYGKGKPVFVSASATGDRVQVEVRDNGMGIPPEKLYSVFERFERAVGGSAVIGGLGLGLYISKEIAEAHRGSIEVESEPGRGSTFRLVLPLRIENSQAAELAFRNRP